MKHIATKQDVEEFLEKYDTFLFDCDGVLWRGSDVLPGSREAIHLLRSRGKRLVFVTNNSTKSRDSYTHKFHKLGFSNVTKDEVFCSAYSAAVYLSKVVEFPKDKKVLIVGESGLEEELTEAGIEWIGGTDPELRRDWDDDAVKTIKRDPSVGCVLAGLDTHINYRKIALAQAQLQDKDCLFLATNIDSTFPSAGHLLPGAGTVIQAIATAAGRAPAAALGKPSKQMMDTIRERFHFDPSRTVMVGDRLNTDMVFGTESGLGTLFVLTGVDSLPELDAAGEEAPPAVPKYYANKLGDLALL